MDQYEGGRLWNLLHDGLIIQVIGQVPGTLFLNVDIDYLRELIGPPGDGFRLELTECTLFELTPYDTYDDLLKPNLDLEILSAEVDDDACVVFCTLGTLKIRCSSTAIMLEDGTPITVAALEEAAKRYWQAFSEGKYVDGRER